MGRHTEENAKAKERYQSDFEETVAETLAQLNILSDELYKVRDNLITLAEKLGCMNSTSILSIKLTSKLRRKSRSRGVKS